MCAAVVAEEDNKNNKVQYCASCGIAGVDDIVLEDCDHCDLVKYCSVECQKDHRPKHREECEKIAAELRDENLFKQPESSHLGDCPICCLPLPLDLSKSVSYSCCSKQIRKGCDYANQKREIEGKLKQRCAFCRKELPNTNAEHIEQWMKRVEANDPVAMRCMGTERYHEGDYKAAYEYWTKAADLGDVKAHYQLSTSYRDGKGVEKDKKREQHHAEQAAIGGHPGARYNLGWTDEELGKMARAAKHYIIAAKLGDDDSLKAVKSLYEEGYYVSKEDFAAALRGHQAAVDATKSPQREEAAGGEFFA